MSCPGTVSGGNIILAVCLGPSSFPQALVGKENPQHPRMSVPGEAARPGQGVGREAGPACAGGAQVTAALVLQGLWHSHHLGLAGILPGETQLLRAACLPWPSPAPHLPEAGLLCLHGPTHRYLVMFPKSVTSIIDKEILAYSTSL